MHSLASDLCATCDAPFGTEESLVQLAVLYGPAVRFL